MRTLLESSNQLTATKADANIILGCVKVHKPWPINKNAWWTVVRSLNKAPAVIISVTINKVALNENLLCRIVESTIPGRNMK